MENYNNYLFRVSSLPHLMAGIKFGKEEYESLVLKEMDAYSKYAKYQAEYDNIVNKDTETAKKKEQQVSKAEDKYFDLKIATKKAEVKKDSVIISEGCKTHLIDIFVANEFERPTKDIKNKYIEKGIEMEDTGIVLHSVLEGKSFEKNILRKDDGFIMGEWDFLDEGVVCDNKCSWDIWTFFRNIKYINNPEQCPYYANMQGYMRILGLNEAKVIYTLVDTPKKLIEAEQRRLKFDFIMNDDAYEMACAEIEKNLTYSDIPLDKKRIIVPIKRDDNFIENIPKVVVACREYLNDLKNKYNGQKLD